MKGIPISGSIADSIYNERRKTFLKALESILQQIGISDPNNFSDHIDSLIQEQLQSERENFISSIAVKLQNDSLEDNDILTADPQTQISQIRCQNNILKATILTELSNFSSLLNKSKKALQKRISQVFTEENLKREQIEIQLRASQSSCKSREQKLARMEQKISELTDTVTLLKTKKSPSSQISALEKKLADKDKEIKAQQQLNDTKISNLQANLDEKEREIQELKRTNATQVYKLEKRLDNQLTSFGQQTSATSDQVSQLQNELSEKEESIVKQNRDSSQRIQLLERKLEEVNHKNALLTAELKQTKTETERVKQELSRTQTQLSLKEDQTSINGSSLIIQDLDDIQQEVLEKDEQISALQSQVLTLSKVSDEVDNLRSNYVRKTKECDDWKRQTETYSKKALDYEEKNRKLSQSLKILETKLNVGDNEKNTLQSDVDHALLISNLRKKKVKKLKKEVEDLKKETEEKRVQLQEAQTTISQLKASSGDVELQTSYLKQQLSLSQSQQNHQMITISSNEEKINSLQKLLSDKDDFIKQLEEAAEQHKFEIVRLQNEVKTLRNDNNVVSSRVELLTKSRQLQEQQTAIQHTEEQLNSANQLLAKTKATCRTLELTNKEQIEQISSLQKRLNSSSQTISK